MYVQFDITRACRKTLKSWMADDKVYHQIDEKRGSIFYLDWIFDYFGTNAEMSPFK